MAYPKVFTWPTPNSAAITASAGYPQGLLPLNGALANPNVPGIVFQGYSRVASVTSTANIAAVNFTINGIYNGQAVQDVITGVNISTVQGTQLFDSITSVSTDSIVGNASVGIGQTGHTHWYLADFNKLISNFAFQAIATATINYSLICTLQDVSTVTSLGSLTLFDPTTAMTGLTASAFNNLEMTPLRYISFRINSSNATGALTAIILENG